MKIPEKPIDAKDTPWSYIGKDALDAAAERMWYFMRETTFIRDYARDGAELPYHVQDSQVQEIAQRAVIDMLGNAVPAMLRQRAEGYGTPPGDDYDRNTQAALRAFADDLEAVHG